MLQSVFYLSVFCCLFLLSKWERRCLRVACRELTEQEIFSASRATLQMTSLSHLASCSRGRRKFLVLLILFLFVCFSMMIVGVRIFFHGTVKMIPSLPIAINIVYFTLPPYFQCYSNAWWGSCNVNLGNILL